MGDYVHPRERDLRNMEAVHGGGVHGSGVWTDERTLNDWHLQNSIKYAGPHHPEYAMTPQPVSRVHCGLHDAELDFRTAVRGIVPGYAGRVPRARDMYGQPASGGITPERGWKRNERTGQMLEQTNVGPMGDRAYADGPEGASTRPHAFTRVHNRVSDEIKPGYAGHVPVARDTFGTSHYRDAWSHRTGKAKHHATEDGALSERTTSSRRIFTSRSHQGAGGGAEGYHPGRSVSAGMNSHLGHRPTPGLADRERMAGRPHSARKSNPGGRYFTLSYTPRQHAPARYWERSSAAASPSSARIHVSV